MHLHTHTYIYARKGIVKKSKAESNKTNLNDNMNEMPKRVSVDFPAPTFSFRWQIEKR